MGTSEQLLQSSLAQWKTTQELMKVGGVNGETRRQVAKEAERCRDSLATRRRTTSNGEDSQADAVEELTQVLDDVISAASSSSAA